MYLNFSFRDMPKNKNARIVSSSTDDGKLVTETRYRDDGSMTARATTDVRGDVTSLSIVTAGGRPIRFTGHEARTIYRTLHRHYGEAGLALGE